MAGSQCHLYLIPTYSSGAQRQVAEGRELGEALTFQAKGSGTTAVPLFSATGSDPINSMASAVPLQAGLLLSYLPPDVISTSWRCEACLQRPGLMLPCLRLGVGTPQIPKPWIPFLLTHNTSTAKPKRASVSLCIRKKWSSCPLA